MPVKEIWIEVPLKNGGTDKVKVEPPSGYIGAPSLHKADIFPIFGSLSRGEEEYVASDGSWWHFDWRGKEK
jgi:hypothetical protein